MIKWLSSWSFWVARSLAVRHRRPNEWAASANDAWPGCSRGRPTNLASATRAVVADAIEYRRRT